MIYAVIDTNVLVSALLTQNPDAATTKVLEALLDGEIAPLYDEDILDEYLNVLTRPKFHFTESVVHTFIRFFRENGYYANRIHSNEFFPDPKDIVFYEVALSHEDAYLVTGNTKHFPATPIVVTPAEMMKIIRNNRNRP